MKIRRRTVDAAAACEPRKRPHEEYPPGTPVPRDELQTRLRHLTEELAQLERPAFGQATTVMVGALAVIVTANVAIFATTEGPLLWFLLLVVLLITALAAIVANRYLDRSGPDDERRAELLGDIAFLEAARVAEPTAAVPNSRWRLSIWRWSSRTPPHA